MHSKPLLFILAPILWVLSLKCEWCPHSNALCTVKKRKETMWSELTLVETSWSQKHESPRLANCGSAQPLLPSCSYKDPKQQKLKPASTGVFSDWSFILSAEGPHKGRPEESRTLCLGLGQRWKLPRWGIHNSDLSTVAHSQLWDGNLFEGRETFLAFLILSPMVSWMLAPKDMSSPLEGVNVTLYGKDFASVI